MFPTAARGPASVGVRPGAPGGLLAGLASSASSASSLGSASFGGGQASGAPVINNAAVGQALKQGRENMNERQRAIEDQKDFDNNQINMLAKMIMQQSGMKTVQNDNLKQRVGYKASSSSAQHMKDVGLAQQNIDKVEANVAKKLIWEGLALESTNEAELIAIIANMSFEERQRYFKQFDLNHRSIYDPLPDKPDAYKIHLITARMNEERMYTF